MKSIIVYCTSGLGNRLRSLSSAAYIAKVTHRKLKIYWDNRIPNGCLATWEELFKNEVESISLEEMVKLEDCKICANRYDIDREEWHFKNPTLRILVDKFGAAGKDSCGILDTQTNLIIFNNNFLPTISLENSHEFIKELVPQDDIQNNIDSFVQELKLDRNIIGVHARGTDFNSTLEYYMNKIKNMVDQNPNLRFFLSTEDPVFEEKIINRFNGKILYRKKKSYITKNEGLPWNNYESFSITTTHAKEAVEDIFLLSNTSIQIFHPESTFCKIALIISNKNN